ncbi:MAG: YbaK/EbsC family protein [Clostridia bacterium]|nr:YbaK/EbsC family protein [Clostridia bacterium]
MAIETVREYLRRFDADSRVLEFDVSSATVELAAKALNTQPGQIAKTLSFMAGEQPLLIVAAGDARIDNGKYKRTFGAKAKMMTAEELDRFTGLQFGGVCPFAIPDNVAIWLDESLRAWETVYPACGSSNSAIEVTLPELEQYSGARGWVDVTKMPAGE